ncbi:MAG: hypothetical protein QNJ94_08785 [Alphaproteobacteria bacterium]|nr:hypothetical protein [Alphaproteobacteria bacterium]
MSLTVTLIVLALAAALLAFSNYMSRCPTEPGKPRLIPYQGLQFVALIAIVLMLAHLVTLFTGEPFKGRGGF